MEINTVDAARGIAWYSEGWKITKPRLGMWVLLGLACWFISIVLNIIPFVGGIAFSIIMPGIAGGIFKAARDWENGTEPSLGHILIAFKDPVTKNGVLTLGAISIGFNLLSTAIIFITMGGFGMHIVMHRADIYSIIHAATGAAITFILLFLLALLFFAAILYAIPLVMFAGVEPVVAMKFSIKACIKNTIPMTVYGIIYLLLCMLTVFTLGLGLIILIPVTITSIYVSFKDIFPEVR
ncbi:MAG: BPSS1780 family membrane protein [Dissulfurimicrobium sp.]|uniref:BPSS1780 family membrane protein n=1 Tax=Dissulfurimicrobium sp. TaxID=2022436 RepID=UPI0040490273